LGAKLSDEKTKRCWLKLVFGGSLSVFLSWEICSEPVGFVKDPAKNKRFRGVGSLDSFYF
jgi:hypothetical protein